MHNDNHPGINKMPTGDKIVLVTLLSGLLLVLIASAISIMQIEEAISVRPYRVSVQPVGLLPNYYCETMDTAAHIAYNCVVSGKMTLVIVPEYRLSSNDIWDNH